jgi:hypothetical protein
VRHVPRRVDVDQQPDAGHDQDHHRGERVEPEPERHGERAPARRLERSSERHGGEPRPVVDRVAPDGAVRGIVLIGRLRSAGLVRGATVSHGPGASAFARRSDRSSRTAPRRAGRREDAPQATAPTAPFGPPAEPAERNPASGRSGTRPISGSSMSPLHQVRVVHAVVSRDGTAR